MSLQLYLEIASYAFNLIGLVVCLAGLTLAQRTRHRWPGYLLAVGGFLIAAFPVLYQMLAATA